MNETLAELVAQMAGESLSRTDVIPWSSPVPAFGSVSQARVATLGLNPSNREFVDEHGRELEGRQRRFHTLRSLHLGSWANATRAHIRAIANSCDDYFSLNPYDAWFRRLDTIVRGTGTSYYDGGGACHLDLVPYATARKWTALTRIERNGLFSITGNVMGNMIRDSQIEVMILNGQTVVSTFESVVGATLSARQMKNWSLPRSKGPDVVGTSYNGLISRIGGIDLGRNILILGFNHNIQSSFGVTTKVVSAIRNWVQSSVKIGL